MIAPIAPESEQTLDIVISRASGSRTRLLTAREQRVVEQVFGMEAGLSSYEGNQSTQFMRQLRSFADFTPIRKESTYAIFYDGRNVPVAGKFYSDAETLNADYLRRREMSLHGHMLFCDFNKVFDGDRIRISLPFMLGEGASEEVIDSYFATNDYSEKPPSGFVTLPISPDRTAPPLKVLRGRAHRHALEPEPGDPECVTKYLPQLEYA